MQSTKLRLAKQFAESQAAQGICLHVSVVGQQVGRRGHECTLALLVGGSICKDERGMMKRKQIKEKLDRAVVVC